MKLCNQFSRPSLARLLRLHQSRAPEEAFRLIEDLDYGYSLLQICRDGDVVSVERFKEPSTEAEQIAALNRYPGTIQINGSPGMYVSADELRERIQKSMWLFTKMKSAKC